MAFSMNLNDLANAQYGAVTGRKRKTPYTAFLTAMGPYARDAARQDQLDTIRSSELAQNAEQFNAEQDQLRANNAIMAEQAGKAQTLGLVSTGISGAGVINQIYPLKDIAAAAIKAGTKLYTAATGAGAGAGASGAGATGAGMYGGSGVTYAADGTVASGGAGSSIGSVAYPLAIIAAANMARDAWGAPKKKWRGEGKTATEKLFDDPGMGLGANVPGMLFGEGSEMARIPNQVGENFARFAGNPISKAFGGDFSGAAKELANAPYDTLQSLGVDKGTSYAVNANLNAPGYIYAEADKGNLAPVKNYIGAGDPVTAAISTGLQNSGLGTVGEVASTILNPVGAIASRCIIVTACTNRDSYEVEIARKYRDQFLDADQLRGYYYIAEKIVPGLERNENARKSVKKWLVDRLIDYGAYHLGLKDTRPSWSSVAVSGAFLGTIKIIGMILPRYVRANGKVY